MCWRPRSSSDVPSRPRSARRLLVAAALLLAAPRASAQSLPADTRIDVQQFKPGAGGTDVLGVLGAGTLPHLGWHLGLYLHFADDPLVLADGVDNRTLLRIVDYQLTFDLVGAVSLWNRLELGVALPVTVQSSEDATRINTKFKDGIPGGGLGDLRVTPKVKIVESSGFRLAAAATVFFRTGNDQAFLSGGWNIQPRVLLDYTFDNKLRLLANAGFNLRPEGEQQFVNLRVGHEFVWGAGLELPFHVRKHDFAWLLTVSGLVGLSQPGIEEAPVEALTALRYQILRPLAILAGGGAGLTEGYGAPDYRLFVGLLFTDRRDAPPKPKPPAPCPLGPEDLDGFEDGDNCLDPDNDKDGLSTRRINVRTSPRRRTAIATTTAAPTSSSPSTATATASPTARTAARRIPRTRTAGRTRTAAPIPTMTRTASSTSMTSARTSPRSITRSTTPTAAPTPTGTATRSPTPPTPAPTSRARPTRIRRRTAAPAWSRSGAGSSSSSRRCSSPRIRT